MLVLLGVATLMQLWLTLLRQVGISMLLGL